MRKWIFRTASTVIGVILPPIVSPFIVWSIAIAMIVMMGCQKNSFTIDSAIPPEDALADFARTELHLPLKSDLTLAKKADVEFVSRLSPGTIKVVEAFLKPAGEKIRIIAARPIGNYLLLWIAFPEVADGGIDLIFSTEKKRVVGVFCGGYQG